MREIRSTGQFKRDAKRVQKRGLDLARLREVVERLAAGDFT